MPPRTLAAEVARLFAAAAEPIYLLDDERTLVYCNAACCAWLGAAAEELIGQKCDFHSSSVAEPAVQRVAGLCPPAEAFSGQRLTAVVSHAAADTLYRRNAEFIPLTDESGQCSAVLAIVAAQDLPIGNVEPRNIDDRDEPAALHARLAELHAQLRAHWQQDRLLGDSPAMNRVRAQVQLASQSTAAVVVVGPVGSGRQHVARAIHYAAAGAETTLTPLACATLGVELLRSELARLLAGRDGSGQPAVNSLLLSDVQDLPAEVQSELAERLAGPACSVGLSPRHSMDSCPAASVRIIVTSTKPLDELAKRGEFRSDLACRLSTIVIHLPPLAARPEDIPLLAQMFLEELNARGGKQLSGFSPETLDQLAAYPWPGNIDELAAMVREAFDRAERPLIAPADLPQRIYLAAAAGRRPRRDVEPIELESFLARIELEMIQRALRLAKGNKTKAARLLGLTRPRLYRRMVQLGLVQDERV
jgi:DNA-binding NtrC family response regulator